MKIALISFEYPPAVAIGGIGTYARMASRMLANHGHTVCVYAAGHDQSVEQPLPNLKVQRVTALNRRAFSAALLPFLLSDHRQHPFDVIEAPEIGPEGIDAFTALPAVARVVKLHTPGFLIGRNTFDPLSIFERLRFLIGSWRRGHWQSLNHAAYVRSADQEFHCARLADEIAAPSQSIADLVSKEWALDPAKVHVYPLPFQATEALLELPVPDTLRTIGFLGRLEARKGIIELVNAIPEILRQAPGLRFRFIGPSWHYQKTDMKSWIESRLKHHLASVDFTGGVQPDQIPGELARCDVLILPSRWENFPFACWEALASGRAVIGSSAGGMAEVIQHGVSGLLIPPRSPRAIIDAVLSFKATPRKIPAFGAAGRARVRQLLAVERILPLQLASYQRAIHQAALRNSCQPSAAL